LSCGVWLSFREPPVSSEGGSHGSPNTVAARYSNRTKADIRSSRVSRQSWQRENRFRICEEAAGVLARRRGRGVFYIQKGKVKLTVISEHGKEAVVAILGPGEFCGEGCLTGQPKRLPTATAMSECEIMRVEKAAFVRVLHEEPVFSEIFVSYLLTRTIRVEADLVDQLFNSSEKRLARTLLQLANFGNAGVPEPIIAKISQEMLAEMIGTTRRRRAPHNLRSNCNSD
jgi:CRP-like cAMP-binding protein